MTDDDEQLVCYVCHELSRHQCKHCKCYFNHGLSQCSKCCDDRVGPEEIGIHRDKTKRGVCRVCARVKRDKRRKKDQDRKSTNNEWKPASLWKRLSAEVRNDLEIQFKAHKIWLHKGSVKSTRDIESEYRRIQYEEGWISEVDGRLQDHYKNWCRRLDK